MQFFVLTGDDHGAIASRRFDLVAEFAQNGTAERFDAAMQADEFLAAVRSPSLFGPARVLLVDNAHELDADHAAVLSTVTSSAVVVARASKWLSRHRAIPAVVETFKKPDERSLPDYLKRYARARGITIPQQGVALLAKACRDNPDWARQIVDVCALLKVVSPSVSQLEKLLGDRQSSPRPYEVSAAAERGDVDAALTLMALCEPFSLVGHLRQRILDLAAVNDSEALTGRNFSPARITKLKSQARTISPPQLASLLQAVVDADSALRGGQSSAAVPRLVALYSKVLSPQRSSD